MEQARVLFFASEHVLIADELVGQGGRDAVMLSAEQVLHRARQLGADAILLAHNHPSGMLEPSRADLAATETLHAHATRNGIRLLDHVLVAGRRCRSILTAVRGGLAAGAQVTLRDSGSLDESGAGWLGSPANTAEKAARLRWGLAATVDAGGPGMVRSERLDCAQLLLRLRAHRENFLPDELFGEPAWDMLLDLYAQELSGRQVTVSSLCVAARVPSTTALRWIRVMTDRGLFDRRDDPSDGRRVLVELTPQARDAVTRYLDYANALLVAGRKPSGEGRANSNP